MITMTKITKIAVVAVEIEVVETAMDVVEEMEVGISIVAEVTKLPTAPTFTGDTAYVNGHICQYKSETTNPKYVLVTLEKLSYYVIELAIFNEEVEECFTRHNTLKENIQRLYSVIWGQSRKLLRANLVGLKNFKYFNDGKDTPTLLIEKKSISYEYN